MGSFVAWIKAVSRHWGSLVTGGVVIGLLSVWQGTGHTVEPWAYWTVAILGLVVAFYRAWRDQSLKYSQAISASNEKDETINKLQETIRQLQDDSKPKLKAVAPQCVGSLGEDGYADLLFPITIANTGAPSATYGWHLHYKAPTVDEQTFSFCRIGRLSIADEAKGISGVLTDAEGIVEKTMKPIERGATVSGWLRFRIPNGKQVTDDFNNGRVAMKIHFRDIMDNEYDIIYHSSPKEGALLYVPGTDNPFIENKRTELKP